MKKRGKSSAGSKLCAAAYIIPIIASSVIAILNIVYLIILVTDKGSTASVSDFAETNTISIIGIAVSVWIGLSITNVLDKRKLEQTEKDVRIIQDGLLFTKQTAKNTLLQDLYSDSGNAMSVWVAEQLSEVDDGMLDGNVYSRLRDEEYYYRMIRRKEAGQNLSVVTKLYDQCNRAVKEILYEKNDVNRLIEKILTLREVEIQFLLAYSLPDEEAEENFEEAVKFYWRHMDEFNFGKLSLKTTKEIIKEAKTWKEETELIESFKRHIQGETDANLQIFAYFLNFIGETHSKLVHLQKENSRKNTRKYAVWFCRFATLTAKEAKRERETYYRNLGCALERAGNADYNKKKDAEKAEHDEKEDIEALEVFESAEKQYLAALRLDPLCENTYYCLCSVYNKQFETLTGLKYVEPGKRNRLKTVTQDIRKKANGILEKYSVALYLYEEHCPDKQNRLYLMLFFYYRNCYLIEEIKEKQKEYAKIIRFYLFVLWRLRGAADDDANKCGTAICSDNSLETPADVESKRSGKGRRMIQQTG